jgi:OFA family oxalate/formate antiporter-like MFS transporter
MLIEKAPCLLSFRLNHIFYGWWIVIASFIIALYTGGIIFYGFTAFIDPLIREFGWSYTEISFAMSLRGIEMSFLSPLIGFLVDRYGSRRLVFWGVITMSLGFFTFSATQSLWMFYASFVLIAFGGGGCASVVFMRVVTNWFRRRAGLALGVISSGFGASGLIVPLIVYLIDTSGWRIALILLGVGTLIVGIPLAFVIRDTPEICGLHPDGQDTNTMIVGASKKINIEEEFMSFRDALKHRAFLFLAISEFLRMLAIGALVTHIMPYLNILHISRTTAGLMTGSLAFLSIFGRLGFGWMADLFDKRIIMVASFSLLSLGFFLFCYVDIPWVMIVFLIIFPIGFGGTIVLRGAFLLEYFGQRTFGRLLGITMGVAAAGSIIGPTMAGYIFDTMGNYYYTWISLGIASSVSVLLVIFIGPKPKAMSL